MNGRRIDGVEALEFPSDLDRHPLLAWMGDDWVRFVTLALLAQFRKQDPGTELVTIECEGAPDLETGAQAASGAVTAVQLRLPLQLLLRDSSRTEWRLRGVGGFAGQGLDGREPPRNSVSFELESTQRA